MKKISTIVIVLCIIINIYNFLPTATTYLMNKISLEWASKTGPLGDTFGGILSPIIGLISFVFIYKTFKEQRSQFYVNRITDIIYRQIQRIDENLSSHTFYLKSDKVIGRAGLYSINHVFQNVPTWVGTDELSAEQGDISNLIDIINDNIKQLIDYYDHILISLAILTKNVSINNLDNSQKKEFYNLFLLNLGINAEDNIDKILSILKEIEKYENAKDDNLNFADTLNDQFNIFGIEQLKNILTDVVKIIHSNVDGSA